MLKGHFKKITVVILLTAGMAMGQGLFAGPPKDIVDTAISRGQFSKFVRALQVTGLDYTLKGPGPITVFAPTDAAFDKLPAGRVNCHGGLRRTRSRYLPGDEPATDERFSVGPKSRCRKHRES